MKVWKVIVVGGALFLGGKYLLSLKKLGDKAVVQTGGKVKKATIEGVGIELKFNIKNPTNTSIEMAKPLIKISHKGAVLASSSMALVEIPEDAKSTKGRILIRPNSETGIITTSVLLPYLSLVGTGANLFARLKNKLDPNAQQETVDFEIGINSTVFANGVHIPYESISTIKV